MNYRTRCLNCGKQNGLHGLLNDACPIVDATQGHERFHPTMRFKGPPAKRSARRFKKTKT